jgi:predicted phage-related endonuclease
VKGGDDFPEDKTNTRKLLGQCLEPGLLDVYGRIHHCTVVHNTKTIEHPTLAIVAGTPDGLIEGERMGIDAKVVAPDQSRKWGDDADDIPYHIILQAYWYMLLTGLSKWIIVALIGGWLRFYTITRDAEAEKIMLLRVTEWWDRYVIGDERPPFGESEHAAQWLQQVYSKPRPEIREASEAETALLREYLTVRLAEQKLIGQKDRLANDIKDAIGNSEGLTWEGDGRFTWKMTKAGGTDWKSMAIALYTNFVKDPTERVELLARYTRPGQRRVHVSHPLLLERNGMEVL